MGKKLHKYMDVDVVAFLEEKMKGNTKHFQSDFEYDKDKFARFVQSEHKEDKTLLWLSRPHGTQCVRESDAYLKGTEGHTFWQYYANQEAGSKYVAFAVELTGVQDGVIRGNLYELDYMKHAEMVKKEAQPAYEVVKTFEDGFTHQTSFARSSHGYWLDMVEEHGPIVESRAIPEDMALLKMVLAEQKQARAGMKAAAWKPVSLEDVLKDAKAKAGAPAISAKEREIERC